MPRCFEVLQPAVSLGEAKDCGGWGNVRCETTMKEGAESIFLIAPDFKYLIHTKHINPDVQMPAS